MLPPNLAEDLLTELRGDLDRAKARILDSLLERLERLSVALEPDDDGDPWSAPPPEPLDADEYRALVVPAPAPAPASEPVADEEPVVKAPKTPRRAKAAPADEDAPAPSRVRAPKAVGLVPEPGRGAEAPMPVVAEADTDGPF